MALLNYRDGEAGYATAAAVMVSLALALIASAISAQALQALRLARADSDRKAAVRTLDNAAVRAIVALLTTKQSARLHWVDVAEVAPVDIIAEPEAAKLAFDQASGLAAGVRGQLGLTVEDVAALLQEAAADPYGTDLAALDVHPMWRTCAASLFSPWGGVNLGMATAAAPAPGALSWRVGSVWRLRLSADGWSEDRIVRFTGDPTLPAAIMRRRILRRQEGGSECDALLAPSDQA